MATVAPAPDVRAPRPVPAPPVPEAARPRQWPWLLAGAVLAFLLPFVLTDLTSLDRDVFYGVYSAAVFVFCGLWLRFATESPRRVVTRNWRAGLVLAALFTGAMVAIVLAEPATERPHGLDFAAALVWRGVVYGFADGLILSAFPIVAVFSAFAGGRVLDRWRGKVAVGALALAVSLLFTAVYHLGYSDFRGEKLRKPLAGDVVWSIPTLATLSPIASPITHAGLHVSAVVHSYETDTFLPPHGESLDTAQLQAVLDGLVSGPDAVAPGATAYVAGPDGSWSGAAGVADLRTGAAMPVDARMRLESVSKAWTAALVLRLAADGKLRLADTVERWLPGLLPAGGRITVRQLLNHTSGLIDTNDILAAPERFLGQVDDPALRARLLALARTWSRNASLEFSPRVWIEFAGALPLVSEPGTSYHYSNIGYNLAGLVAERAGGKPLARLYREEIFEPLGLESAAYDPQGPIAGPHARGYDLVGDRIDRTDSHGGIGAEGGIVANAEDEARFLTALMRGELLPAPELRALKAPPWFSAYALGLLYAPSGCAGYAYMHGGAGIAYKTAVWVSVDGERVAVLLTNGMSAESHARVEGAAKELFCAIGSP